MITLIRVFVPLMMLTISLLNAVLTILQLNVFLARPQHVDLGHHGRVFRNHVAMERGQESSFGVINVNPRKTKTVTSVSI